MVKVLTRHFEPQRIVIAERFNFYHRSQGEGESIGHFVAELRLLACSWTFWMTLYVIFGMWVIKQGRATEAIDRGEAHILRCFRTSKVTRNSRVANQTVKVP